MLFTPRPEPSSRRVRAHVSILGITQMHLRSPMVIALWTAIFPGCGHLLLSKNICGMVLFIWEVFINFESKLNLAIYYTFIGQADLAKTVLNKEWIMLYIPTYLFSIWDSYRTTVDMNHQFLLAAYEDAPVKPFTLRTLGINYLDKSSPWTGAVWSLLSPGVGQLITRRIVMAFFLLVWWIVVVYQSKLLPAIHYTAMGQFELAKQVADKQWVLNVPSIFLFGVYDAYVHIVESNKLFEWEQSKFLKQEFQSTNFQMPFCAVRKDGRSMYITASFEQDIHLEMALASLQKHGIQKDDILAVPLDKQDDPRALFDRLHTSDRLSMMDYPIVIAAIFSLFGLIYGFLLQWGPVLWALIGTGAGFGVGVVIKLLMNRMQRQSRRIQPSEVILLVNCRDTKPDTVQDILWDQGALGVSSLALGSDT